MYDVQHIKSCNALNITNLLEIYRLSPAQLAFKYAQSYPLSPYEKARLLHEGTQREYDIIADTLPGDLEILPRIIKKIPLARSKYRIIL